jgi:Ca2+/Na+ antiporter
VISIQYPHTEVNYSSSFALAFPLLLLLLALDLELKNGHLNLLFCEILVTLLLLAFFLFFGHCELLH